MQYQDPHSRHLGVGQTIPGTDLVLEERVALTQMSRVYRVRSEHLGREFCAKFVPRTQRSQRWQQEIQVLSTLHSPHIVKLFRTIELEHDIVLVLDWVRGVNLGTYVAEQGVLSPTDAQRIGRQLAVALIDVHGLGVVHRDLKPANVMIERLPSGDLFARLLDFGISKAVADSRVSTGFVGSPLYAAPEQISEDPVDERTDIYQLGCLLHFMLTGAPPFNESDATTVMNAHLYQPPPRMSDQLSHLRRWSVDNLVLEMLAKAPELRPQSAEEVLAALDKARNEHAGDTHPAASPTSVRAVGRDQSIVTADKSRVVIRQGKVESRFDVPGATITALHVGDDAVLLGTANGSVQRLTVSAATIDELIQLPRVRPIEAITTTLRRIVVADTHGRVFLIDPRSRDYKVIRSSVTPPLTISGASQTEHFVVVDRAGTLTIYDGTTEQVNVDIGMAVRHVAMSPDGYVVGVFGEGCTLVISAIDGSIMHRVVEKRDFDAITFVGGTLIGIGQTHDGPETFNLFG